MKVTSQDYIPVGLTLGGGATGVAILLAIPSPALDKLKQDALEIFTKQNYTEDASHLALSVLFFIMISTFVVGEIASNYSQVDKLWSLTPLFFSWIYAFSSPQNPRLTLMAFVITFWGCRLTLNFNLKGGYKWPPWDGEEDYRWKHTQDLISNYWLWKLFHFGFICFYQNLILFLTTLPCHYVWFNQNPNTNKLNEYDFLIACLILLLVTVEAITDAQNYEFQEEKYKYLNAGTPIKKIPLPYRNGFLSTGMFAISRHMNYFCEQSIWFTLTFFIFAQTKTLPPLPAFGGFALLTGIFQGSMWLQEQITSEKWPLYLEYQKQVPKLFPYGFLLSNKN